MEFVFQNRDMFYASLAQLILAPYPPDYHRFKSIEILKLDFSALFQG